MHSRTLIRPPFALLALLGTCWLAACGGVSDESIRPASAPHYLGAADATGDVSDGSCAVVLRKVGRVQQGPGYLTTCSTGATPQGPCLYVWRGTIDVADAEAAGFTSIELLFSTNQTNGQWYAVTATRAGAAKDGYVPYTFEIDRYTPADGMSMTSLMRTQLTLIPYATTAAGGRLFDHNRIKDPFGAYELTDKNGWAVGEDASTCPALAPPPAPAMPEYVLDYPSFSETLRAGPLHAGGKLKVSYDSRRLRLTQSCMGAQGPASSTTIMMGYKTDGAAAQQRVIETYVQSASGVSQQQQDSVIDLPASAKSIALWFWCVPGFSQGASTNWKYDSNFGKNYQLPVVAAQTKAVDWAGNWKLHAGRSGFVFTLPEPYTYSGFTNMGYSIQAEVYVKGLTDQAQVDRQALRAYVETDLDDQCQPGKTPTRVELSLAAEHVGGYGNNVLYRWGVESPLMRCPNGSYRYRFVFSADGGLTVTPLGNATSSTDPNAAAFRTLVNAK